MAQTLSGQRVTLRSMSQSDAPAIFSMYSDPVSMRYWGYPPYTSLEEAVAHVQEDLASDARGNSISWGIEFEGALIGTTSLHKLDHVNGRAEIGYLLSSRYWGRGFAQEATSLVISYSFGRLMLRRLEADVDPRNAPSMKLLLRLGFQQEGFMRERWCVAGEISDTAFFGLLKRDWDARSL
jgi:ribosomal-protein-alanine N-acetyltransferase